MGASVSDLENLFRNLIKDFEYVPDSKNWSVPEYWATPKETREHNNSGDCEDFALLCREALNAVTVPNRLLVCLTETNELHCVCSTEDGWVFDCRQQFLRANSDLLYKWLLMSGLNPGDRWFTVANTQHN
jgi:predicted transglutaminase-like cysteine proteinase